MMDYKSSLNLPYTEFSMRGNLFIKEPEIIAIWNSDNLYNIIREAKKNKKKFILHDGPPYANGNIHIGHAVNKILKDITVKFQGLMGYDVSFIPGWDCHGLPIEINIEKILGRPKNDIDKKYFREKCRIYALEQVERQKKDFIRLGILGNWDNSYLTIDYKTESNILSVLSKIISKNYLYRGMKPIYWCTKCCSALAITEVEYHKYFTPSVYFRLLSVNSINTAKIFNVNLDKKSLIFFIVWTTMPWTIPANCALMVNPDFNYKLIQVDLFKIYVISEHLVENVMFFLGITTWIILSSIKGVKLEFLLCYNPLINKEIPIVLSHYVTSSLGTGIVHVAPGHGPEDYIVAQKYNFSIINLIDEDGYYYPNILRELNGKNILQGNEIVIDLLRDKNCLLYKDSIEHNYPFCWRHREPVVFRSTTQWFINVDQDVLNKKILSIVYNIQWLPNWGKERICHMLKDYSDWCISRQRVWGVPITLLLHKETNTLHPKTIKIMQYVIEKVKTKGIQVWWDLDLYELLGDEAKYYNKVQDTLDVWFDSGSTYFSVISIHPEYNNLDTKIIDLCIEGSDQYRGWFMSSLVIFSLINSNPNVSLYRKILTHGFVVDQNGRKMSKSLGNVISPQSIVDTLGADVLRLWVASNDYTKDMTISENILKNITEIYRRIRNTARFLLSNLYDFDPNQHIISSNNMLIIDKWMIRRTYICQKNIINNYNNYEFNHVVQSIMYFCSIELGSFYLEVIKDRLYTSKINSKQRRSCQTVLYHIIESLVRWITPIISFTAHEIWKYIPGIRSKYVFTEEWYKELFDFKIENNNLLSDFFWEKLIKIRNEVNKLIEKQRVLKIITHISEVCLTLYVDKNIFSQLIVLQDELPFLFLTSSVIIKNYSDCDNNVYTIVSEEIDNLKILIQKSGYKKCLRCWRYTKDVGYNINYPDICSRCVMNLFGTGENRKFI